MTSRPPPPAPADGDFGVGETGGRAPKAGLLFLGAVGLLSVLFYRDFAFAPDRLLYGSDMLDQGYPLRLLAVEEIRSGRGFPLWNPYVYGGLPYLAILPGPVFYPTSLFYLLMPLHRAIGWTFVLHTALGGGFAWFAARSLGLGRWASAAGGLAFAFSGFVVSTLYGGHDGRMFAMVLMPLAFGCLERGLRTGAPRWFLGLGLAVALQIFTPHVQVMYYSSLALSLWALLRIVGVWREEGHARAPLRLAGLTALGFVAAALVGAAQLLPTWRILDIAVRGSPGETGYGFAASWALPPQELTALLLPDLLGSLERYWGANPFKLHTEYLGAVPLGLAALALTGIREDGRVWRLAVVGGLGLLFALGAATPVHRIAYHLVPMVGRFRAASMMLAPVALCAALLAGIGWQRVLDARQRVGAPGTGAPAVASAAPWLVAGPLLLLAAWAALLPGGLQRWVLNAWFPTGWNPPPAGGEAALRAGGWVALIGLTGTLAVARGVARGRFPEWAVLAVLAVLVADLWRVDARYLQTTTLAEAYPRDAVVRHLEEELEPGERSYPLPGTYGPNHLMVFRIPSVTGSQNFRLEWSERLFGGLGLRNLTRPALWGLLDLRYFVSPQPVGRQELIVPVVEAPGRHLARLEADAPHAFFPEQVEATRDTAEALRRVLSLPHPAASAVVEADEAPPAGRGTARVERYEPNELVLDVEAEEEGLLFVSEIWHPSWRAYVGEEEVPVLRTNVAFRGVVVPAGRHRVRLVYSPAEFRAGFLVSGVSLLGVLAGIGLSSGARRRRGAP